MRKGIVLFSIIYLPLFYVASAPGQHNPVKSQPPVANIQINTTDSTIKINGTILKTYELNNLKKIIGKPDRVKIAVTKSYYEESGGGGLPPTSTPIKVTNYYYIYDKLGIMFFTNNGMYATKGPEKFSIHFSNKRAFTNTAALPFSPANSFKGVMIINEDTVSASKKIIPSGVDYNTKEFPLFKLLFGPTSIATIIDRLYSLTASPYIFLFLDSPKNQRTSYIVIN